jgi:signal transduction histidine kinase
MRLDDKPHKRVKKLFSDLDQLAKGPLAAGENPVQEPETVSPVKNQATVSVLKREMTALRARIRELETQLGVSENQALPVSAPILYEKEKVGYAFRDENLVPLEMTSEGQKKLEHALTAPLTASGETIGAMQVETPSAREWTPDELNLANAVAQQVSLQIQNLSLLATTERARVEAQAATRQFTHQNWESFLDGIHQSERIGFAYDQAAVAPFGAPAPEEPDYQASVNVLEEQIGSLFLKTDPAHPLTEEDKALVSAVARQLGQQVENLRLLADSSRARADAEEATRRLTRENWQSFVGSKADLLGFQYDTVNVTPFEKTELPEDISFLQPLMVRGEAIGQLVTTGLRNVSPEARELANAIAEQVSVHIENLRLFELNEKRARELETVAVVSTTASTVLNPEELLQSVVDLTKERFNLYHAQIYIADEAWKTLLLTAGAGDVGRKMVMTGHAILLDAERSVVARSVSEKKAVIVQDVRTEIDYLPNILLPETRSEMAVPMIVGDKIIGVFDVQSDKIGNFTEEDATIYTTLAVQVAIALQNARLYAEQAAIVTQLRELDRLKSSFLANMSHELRTPLNSILGFSDVMLEELDGPLTDNMRTDLSLIQKNGQHLLHLINDVLDMAKIEAGKMNLNVEKFNLQEVIEDVMGLTSSLAHQKSLDLHIEPDSEHTVEIVADRIRLRQVMINLINNSLKFTEKGEVAIRVALEDNHVLIRVKDTGLGIPPEHLESVFQEFTQVDTTTTRKVGGTGLGLPISRRLIQMHGGRLWAESTGVAGEGSTFYVFLPLEAQIPDDDEPKSVR